MTYENPETSHQQQIEAEHSLGVSKIRLDDSRRFLSMGLRYVLQRPVSKKHLNRINDLYEQYEREFRSHSNAYIRAQTAGCSSSIDILDGVTHVTAVETRRRRALVSSELTRMDAVTRIGLVLRGSAWIGSQGPRRPVEPVLTIPYDEEEVSEEWSRQIDVRQGCGLDLRELLAGTATDVTAELLARERSMIDERYASIHGVELGLTPVPNYVDFS